MARIRTIKPEAFESEDLAAVSVTAERTFFGLLTLADDSGRFRDNPAIVAGRLWALRPEHTATDVAVDLQQLAEVGLICRYTGCDGRTWLHIVTWERHQKINRATESRLPRCPVHQATRHCGKCQAAHCSATGHSTTPAPALVAGIPQHDRTEDSVRPHGGLQHTVCPDSAPRRTSAEGAAAPAGLPESASVDKSEPAPATEGISAGQTAFTEDSLNPHGGLREGSRSGSRIMDPGSVPTGREAPAPDPVSGSVSAKQLVAEYVRECKRRPPEDFLGLLGRKVKTLLEEQFSPDDIRAALDRLRAKGLHPSVLPSLVNEVINAQPPSGSGTSSASGAGPWASASTSAYTPYLNPTGPEPTTFGGRL